jgi:hypothetical protein
MTKIEKNTAEKNFLFYQKIAVYLGLLKGRQATEEAFSHQKRTSIA